MVKRNQLPFGKCPVQKGDFVGPGRQVKFDEMYRKHQLPGSFSERPVAAY